MRFKAVHAIGKKSFEGDRADVVQWLLGTGEYESYYVRSSDGTWMSGGSFVEIAKEDGIPSVPPVATATVQLQIETVPHECLSVDLVRRIIRQEMESLLETLARGAGDSDGSETGELESAGLQAIKSVMERELHHLPHDWNCEKRHGSWNKCTCDIKAV